MKTSILFVVTLLLAFTAVTAFRFRFTQGGPGGPGGPGPDPNATDTTSWDFGNDTDFGSWDDSWDGGNGTDFGAWDDSWDGGNGTDAGSWDGSFDGGNTTDLPSFDAGNFTGGDVPSDIGTAARRMQHFRRLQNVIRRR